MTNTIIVIFTYILQHIVMAIGLSFLFLFLLKKIKMPSLSKLLIGFASTPFAIAFINVIVGYIIPNRSVFYFKASIFLVGFLLILIFRPKKLKINIEKPNNIHKLLIFSIAICLVILVYFIEIPIYDKPIKDNDILIYLNEASEFVSNRNSVEVIRGINDSPDGSVRGDFHGFIFPSYLSNAIFYNQNIGLENQLIIKIAVHICFIYMIIAIFSYGLLFKQKSLGVSLISVLLIFIIPRFSYVITRYTRDTFRLISLMNITTLFLAIDKNSIDQIFNSKKREKLRIYFCIFILIIMALSGHTLGAIYLVSLFLAWLIMRIKEKCKFEKLFPLFLIIIISVLIGGSRYFMAYLGYGDLRGNSHSYFAVSGTALEELREDPLSDRYDEILKLNTVDTILNIFSRDNYLISLPSFILSLIFLFYSKKINDKLIFNSLLYLLLFLPFTGIFDFLQPFKEYFFVNSRYMLHIYPIGIVSISYFLDSLFGNINEKN